MSETQEKPPVNADTGITLAFGRAFRGEKPHITWEGDEWECCARDGLLGFGPTPSDAFADWRYARWLKTGQHA